MTMIDDDGVVGGGVAQQCCQRLRLSVSRFSLSLSVSTSSRRSHALGEKDCRRWTMPTLRPTRIARRTLPCYLVAVLGLIFLWPCCSRQFQFFTTRPKRELKNFNRISFQARGQNTYGWSNFTNRTVANAMQ